MDCFGTYFTHVQTCDVIRVQSATEWTASVHTLHQKNLTKLHKSKKALKHCTVGSANVPVCANINIYIYIIYLYLYYTGFFPLNHPNVSLDPVPFTSSAGEVLLDPRTLIGHTVA